MEALYCICKEETGSMSTTLYKNVTYRYEYASYTNIKVFNGLGNYVYFYEESFKKYFCISKKEIRKAKLEKLKSL